MNTSPFSVKLFGVSATVKLMSFDDSDRVEWKRLFDNWKTLSQGMKDYKARGVNIPEGISEVAFCLYSGSKRFISLSKSDEKLPTSFDTYNLETMKAEQIKATSVKKDLTSFGPKSRWDDLYFLDFYANGKLDGSFDVYKIPNELIYKSQVNIKQTFEDQQLQLRRPRFSIKQDIIFKTGLKPLAENVKVWL